MGDKSENSKMNEQIIEELTKDLESSCIRANNNPASNDNIKDSTEKNGNSSGACSERVGIINDNADECETGAKGDTNFPQDYIDEESLKDRELTLSEDEKEVCSCLQSLWLLQNYISNHRILYLPMYLSFSDP